jgi:hypothetical protein
VPSWRRRGIAYRIAQGSMGNPRPGPLRPDDPRPLLLPGARVIERTSAGVSAGTRRKSRAGDEWDQASATKKRGSEGAVSTTQ